jgi:hypothetical protein
VKGQLTSCPRPIGYGYWSMNELALVPLGMVFFRRNGERLERPSISRDSSFLLPGAMDGD